MGVAPYECICCLPTLQAGTGVSKSFTSFSFSGRVTVTVTLLQTTFASVTVRPLATGIKVTGHGPSTARFTVSEVHTQLSVEFDDMWQQHALFIFADPLEENVPPMFPVGDGGHGNEGRLSIGSPLGEVVSREHGGGRGQHGQVVYLPPGEHRIILQPKSDVTFYLAGSKQ